VVVSRVCEKIEIMTVLFGKAVLLSLAVDGLPRELAMFSQQPPDPDVAP